MRIALTAVIWLIMIGGLSLYLHQRDKNLPAALPIPSLAPAPPEKYALEITPTFSPEADPFALEKERAASPLVVRLGEHELFRSEQPLRAGRPVSVHPVTGLVAGRNELYLQASPPVSEALMDHAVRVRLLQGDREIFDETVWGTNGATVAGSIPFTLEQPGEDRHDH